MSDVPVDYNGSIQKSRDSNNGHTQNHSIRIRTRPTNCGTVGARYRRTSPISIHRVEDLHIHQNQERKKINGGIAYGTGGRKRCKARPNDSDKPGTEIVSTEKMQSRHLHQTHDT